MSFIHSFIILNPFGQRKKGCLKLKLETLALSTLTFDISGMAQIHPEKTRLRLVVGWYQNELTHTKEVCVGCTGNTIRSKSG